MPLTLFFHINYRTLWSAVSIHSTKYKYSGAERCIMISLYCYFDFYNVPIFHIDQAIFESQLFQQGKHKIVHCTTYCTSVLIKCSKSSHQLTNTHSFSLTNTFYQTHTKYCMHTFTWITPLGTIGRCSTSQSTKKKYFLKVILVHCSSQEKKKLIHIYDSVTEFT